MCNCAAICLFVLPSATSLSRTSALCEVVVRISIPIEVVVPEFLVWKHRVSSATDFQRAPKLSLGTKFFDPVQNLVMILQPFLQPRPFRAFHVLVRRAPVAILVLANPIQELEG